MWRTYIVDHNQTAERDKPRLGRGKCDVRIVGADLSAHGRLKPTLQKSEIIPLLILSLTTTRQMKGDTSESRICPQLTCPQLTINGHKNRPLGAFF